MFQVNLFSLTLKNMKPELSLADLPDVVMDGVLQGFYPRDVRVSFDEPSASSSTVGLKFQFVVFSVLKQSSQIHKGGKTNEATELHDA